MTPVALDDVPVALQTTVDPQNIDSAPIENEVDERCGICLEEFTSANPEIAPFACR